MFNPAYLQLSDDGIFYLRWPIPRRFHPAKKASTLRLSLRTRDRRTALRFSRLASQIADDVIAAGSAHGMRYDEVRSLMKDHFQQKLVQCVESINRTGPLSISDRQTFQNSVLIAEEAISTPSGIAIDDPTDKELLSRFIDKYSLTIEEGTEPYQWLHSELKKSYRDFAKAVLDHDSGLDAYDFHAAPSVSRNTPILQEASPVAGMTIAELGCVDKRDSQIIGDLVQGGLLIGGIDGLSERYERRGMGDHRSFVAIRTRSLGTAITG